MKNNKNFHTKMIALLLFGLAVLSSSVALGATPSANAATSATPRITVNVGSVISLSAGDINIDVASPSPIGTFATGTGTVSVTTNDIAGYSVYLTSNDTTTSLNHATAATKIDSISAATTINSSTTKFSTNNTWGWSKDGSVFYPVAAKGAKHSASVNTLYRKTAAAASTADASTLTIGATVDSTLTSGAYSGTLLLTAIPNSDATTLAVYDSTI